MGLFIVARRNFVKFIREIKFPIIVIKVIYN